MTTREQKIVKVGILGVLMNVFLVITKALIGFLSGSVAILMDALNNLTDVLSSLITIVGTKLAARAPDKNHPFGHGRFEDLTTFFLSLIILIAGAGAISESIPTILNPTPTDYSLLTLVFLLLAITLKFLFSRHAASVGKKINSMTLRATATDSFFDALITLSTLVCALLAKYLNLNLEGFVGVLIGIFIIKNGAEILGTSLRSLLGLRASSELSKKLKKYVLSFPNINGVYDLMLHNYGPVSLYGSLHVEVPDTLSAREIHKLTREITEQVYARFGIILTVGIYASSTDHRLDQIRAFLDSYIKSSPNILSYHALYLDRTEKTVALDLVLDFSCRDKLSLEKALLSELKKLSPEYEYKITLDLDTSD